jgi:hypothetical protein
MNILLHRLTESLQNKSVGAIWVTVWTILSITLAAALYGTMLCIHSFLVIYGVEAPVSNYLMIANLSFLGLLTIIVTLGVFSAQQLSRVDQAIRHTLLSVREGDLSARVDLRDYPECRGLETLVNDTLEVVQHRIETTSIS